MADVMKTLGMILSSVVLAIFSTSCLQQETTLSLNKDGSGTVTEKTIFGAQMVAMMTQFAEPGEDPVAGMIAEAKEKAEASVKEMGEGVTLKEVTPLKDKGQQGMLVVYAFKDINQMKYVYSPGGGSKDEGEVETQKKDREPMQFAYADGVLTLKSDFKKSKDEAAGEEQAADEEMNPQQLAMAKQMMGDMRFALFIELPGGIAESNATHVEGNKVTLMDLHMGKLLDNPEKFKELQKKEPSNPAEIGEMLKGIEGLKIETAEKLSIKLK